MMKTVQYPYTVHTQKLSGGCDIAYIDEGSGDTTLLFVHGLALFSLSWQRNIDTLKQKYRCIAVDLPGNGLSGKGNYPYGIAYFAESVYELIQLLGIRNICLVGHSMGGQVVMKLLTLHPDAANRMILCAPAGFETFNGFQKGLYKGTLLFLDHFSSEENSLRKVIQMSFFRHPEYIREMADDLVEIIRSQPVQQYRNMIEACIDGMLDEPVYEDLPLVWQKALVIFGDRDALIPNRLIHPVTTRHIAEEGVQRLPNAELVMLPRCGHFVQIEQADEVNRLIMNFLESSP